MSAFFVLSILYCYSSKNRKFLYSYRNMIQFVCCHPYTGKERGCSREYSYIVFGFYRGKCNRLLHLQMAGYETVSGNEPKE